MEQILLSLFFEVDLLRRQKVIPRDQLMRSSLRFTALDVCAQNCFCLFSVHSAEA